MGGRGDLLYYFQFSATVAGEESALDGAEQASLPGVVHIDAGPAWREEEAVGNLS